MTQLTNQLIHYDATLQSKLPAPKLNYTTCDLYKTAENQQFVQQYH